MKKFNLFQEEVNKTKIFQKIIKKILKNVAASGFSILTKKYLCNYMSLTL